MSQYYKEEFEFDWFWLRKDGKILQFCTAGKGIVPDSIVENIKLQEFILDFFIKSKKNSGFRPVMHNLPSDIDRRRIKYYVSISKYYSTRGAYAFDMVDSQNANRRYALMTVPTVPLHVSKVPIEIAQALEGSCYGEFDIKIAEADRQLIEETPKRTRFSWIRNPFS